MTTDAKSLAERKADEYCHGQGILFEYNKRDAYLAGFAAALECEEVKAMREAFEYFFQNTTMKGTTLKVHQALKAVQAFDALADGLNK